MSEANARALQAERLANESKDALHLAEVAKAEAEARATAAEAAARAEANARLLALATRSAEGAAWQQGLSKAIETVVRTAAAEREGAEAAAAGQAKATAAEARAVAAEANAKEAFEALRAASAQQAQDMLSVLDRAD